MTENDCDNSISLELEDHPTFSLISIPTMRVSGNIGDKSTAKRKDTCNYLTFKSTKRSLAFYLLPFQQLHSFLRRTISQCGLYAWGGIGGRVRISHPVPCSLPSCLLIPLP